jgi:uncharacterized lipoprotein YddW (UPF0748 family)
VPRSEARLSLPHAWRVGVLALAIKAALVAAFFHCGLPLALGQTVEVRGTWLTTTANNAIATPADTARSMQKLREIGLNTVYVEAWKNGYTQYPSLVLARTVGVTQRPTAAAQDPSDSKQLPARDLLQETLIEAHRNGLHYIAWFEYGFMAAHASTMNHLRRMKPQWLSRDINGSEVAPNGFVWMNPLHPEARRFLLDITLEAMQRYDLDGVQFDDRIVWPYVTMGYDDYTRSVYAAEHAGRQPPTDPRDPAWMRWRADKLNALVREFVAELRAARPALLLSLSPAVYPWSFEHYLLEWPQWALWPKHQQWDEFVPQAYRTSYAAFDSTWLEQTQALKSTGAYQPQALLAGIRINGAGEPSSWPQLKDSIALARKLKQGGHVLWFSKGVLDNFANELTTLYAQDGPALHPRLPKGWRRPAVALQRSDSGWVFGPNVEPPPPGRYRAIGFDGQAWRYLQDLVLPNAQAVRVSTERSSCCERVELIVDRRGDIPR